MVHVLIVDDHFVVRSGLGISLDMEEDIDVLEMVDSGEEAIRVYQETRPDVVLMDLQLAEMNGIESMKAILALDPEAKVLIFSSFARDDEIRLALDSGAMGYLQKTASREELLNALRNIAEGKRALPPALEARLSDPNQAPHVTPREREILVLVAEGHANKQIASLLGISEDTVKQHVSRVLHKFGVNDRAQATAEAIRRGIVKM